MDALAGAALRDVNFPKPVKLTSLPPTARPRASGGRASTACASIAAEPNGWPLGDELDLFWAGEATSGSDGSCGAEGRAADADTETGDARMHVTGRRWRQAVIGGPPGSAGRRTGLASR
jgi:hypothetical protein